MVLHITSTTDPSLTDVDYILVKEHEVLKYARAVSSSSGTKTLSYKDAFQPILTSLYASSHVLAYEWVDSETSDKGLILIRFTYNSTHFTVHDSISLNLHASGFMRMNYDDNAWLSIIYEDEDGTLSFTQIQLAGFILKSYIKLKMPVYQEAWAMIYPVGYSFDYICYVENNKFKIVNHAQNRHPDWCEDYESEIANVTDLNQSNFTVGWITYTVLNQEVIDTYLNTVELIYTDTSATSTQGNFAEVQCPKIRSSLNDFFFYNLTLYKNSTATSHYVTTYFESYYNFSCPLNTSIGVGFTNFTVDTTVKFDNGTIASWASINEVNNWLYLGNVSVDTYEDNVILVMRASNDQGLEAFGYANVTIVNLPPYNNTALSNFTLVVGSSNQTYNVSGLFSDYEGENFTLTSDTSNSDCVEFSNDIFTIIPTNWSTN